MSILMNLIPDGIDFNYITLTQRIISLMIQRNAQLAIQHYQPDVLVNIPMNRFGSFEYDKVKKIARIGRAKMRKALMDNQ